MFLDSHYGGPAPYSRRNRHAMRQDLSDIIERALAMLDALDGDPDLEPEEDRGVEDEPQCDEIDHAAEWKRAEWRRA